MGDNSLTTMNEWMNEWNSLFYIGWKLHRLKPGKL